MKMKTHIMIAAILLSLTTPLASAERVGPIEASPYRVGACVDELYQPGYNECWGLVMTCPVTNLPGVGHWYEGPNNSYYIWCYASPTVVVGPVAPEAGACTHTEGNDIVCVGYLVVNDGECFGTRTHDPDGNNPPQYNCGVVTPS